MDTQVNVGNVSALDDNNSTDCYWSGQGPICDGKCRPGETTVASRKNDGNINRIYTNLFNCFFFLFFFKLLKFKISSGNGCIIGKKKYNIFKHSTDEIELI